MSKLFVLIVLGAVLAVVKAATLALAVTLLLFLVFAFIRHPRDTLLFLGSMGLLSLATAQPLACVITLGVLGGAVVVTDARRQPHKQVLLTAACEHHSN